MGNKSGLPKGHYYLVWASSKNKDKADEISTLIADVSKEVSQWPRWLRENAENLFPKKEDVNLGNRETSFGQSER